MTKVLALLIVIAASFMGGVLVGAAVTIQDRTIIYTDVIPSVTSELEGVNGDR